ncbi:hypothetical protein P7D38_12415, partial [Enterococcus dongliensis]|uniref:hypothetical protein n=1 Tax=Enterococcus dongliensis TaxID=2559925 RepID=UPI002891961A
IVIPPAIFFYYSTLFDSRFKTLQQNLVSSTSFLFAAISPGDAINTFIRFMVFIYCTFLFMSL